LKWQPPAVGGLGFAGRQRLTAGRPCTAVANPAGGNGAITESP